MGHTLQEAHGEELWYTILVGSVGTEPPVLGDALLQRERLSRCFVEKSSSPVGDNGGAAIVGGETPSCVSSSGSPQQLTHVRRGSD